MARAVQYFDIRILADRTFTKAMVATSPLRTLGQCIAVALASVIVFGCSNSGQLETAPVSGRVLLDGKPLTFGVVTFVPSLGRAAKGDVQADGSFRLGTYKGDDGAIIGKHKASVIAIRPSASGGSSAERTDSVFVLPSSYAIPEESGFEFEVKAGEANKFTLQLKSE
jgi:hypothetical protein